MCVSSSCEAKTLTISEGQRCSGASITPCLQLLQCKISRVFPSHFAFLNNIMVPSLDRITLRDIFLPFSLYSHQTSIFTKYQSAITIFFSNLYHVCFLLLVINHTSLSEYCIARQFSSTQISCSQISPSQYTLVVKQFCHALTHFCYSLVWDEYQLNSCQGLTELLCRADLLFSFFLSQSILSFITLVQSTSPNPSLHFCQYSLPPGIFHYYEQIPSHSNASHVSFYSSFFLKIYSQSA